MRTIIINHESQRDLWRKVEKEMKTGEWIFFIEPALTGGETAVTLKP